MNAQTIYCFVVSKKQHWHPRWKAIQQSAAGKVTRHLPWIVFAGSQYATGDLRDTHVVLSILSVLKIAIVMPSYPAPSTPVQHEHARKRNYGKSLKCLFHHNYAFTRRFDSYSITNKALVAFWQEFHFKFRYLSVSSHGWIFCVFSFLLKFSI